jgi:hypothetical protein
MYYITPSLLQLDRAQDLPAEYFAKAWLIVRFATCQDCMFDLLLCTGILPSI